MFVTFDVLKFDTTSSVNLEQVLNMLCMFVTFAVLNFVTSNDDKPEQLANM